MNQPLKINDVNLPILLGKSPAGDNSLSLQLYIPENLRFFGGHFPGCPVVPGVSQIDWAVKFAQLQLPEIERTEIKKLKFQRPMTPGKEVTLIIYFDLNKPFLRFSFQGTGWEYSSGEIHWDSPHAKSMCRDTCL